MVSEKDVVLKCAVSKLEEYLSENPDCEYVLKSDIESCFDNISHEWLLDNFPIKPELLRKFLILMALVKWI